MKKLLTWGFTALALLWGCVTALPSQAAITPDYEVKFLLNSQHVLDASHHLNEQSRGFFHIQEKPTDVDVQYIDTPHHDFSQAGWTQRMRHKEGKNKLEMTYKKRYPITNGDITAAIQQAAQDGFDKTSTPYKAQIDWGWHNMTLSLSDTQKIPSYDSLPSASQSKHLIATYMPVEGRQSISLSKECILYGPLTYQKYTGTLAGQAIDIEVWPIPNSSEYITELSFKAATYTEAAKKREKIQNILETNQIVKAKDSLKTSKILNSY